jgi:dsDNA-binding SOS-regulon protein
MLPAWATVTIAVVGSALAGVVVGVFRTRHERNESFKDRMLTAADDLATGLTQALLVVRQALEEIEDWVVEQREFAQTDLKEARRLIDEAAARVARIELLFGVESRATTAAASCPDDPSSSGLDPGRRRRHSSDLGSRGEQFQPAQQAYREFTTSARDAVSNYGRFRLGA